MPGRSADRSPSRNPRPVLPVALEAENGASFSVSHAVHST